MTRTMNRYSTEFFWLLECMGNIAHQVEFLAGIASSSAKSYHASAEYVFSRGGLEACLVSTCVMMARVRSWWSMSYFSSLRNMMVVAGHLATVKGTQSLQIQTVVLLGGLFSWVFFCAMVTLTFELAGDIAWMNNPVPVPDWYEEGSRDDWHNVRIWTVGEGMYYVSVTMLTVGYGDFKPFTFVGRIFAMFVIGVGVLIAGATQLALEKALREQRLGYGSYQNKVQGEMHVVVCGDPTPEVAVDFVREFYHPDRDAETLDIVFLVPDVEPIRDEVKELMRDNAYSHSAERVFFMHGSVLTYGDLERISPSMAAAFFVFPNTLEDKQTQDRKSLLETFHLRNNAPQARVVTLLLNYNPAYDRQFRNDPMVDSVCLEQLRLSLLGKSCLVPGFGVLILNLFQTFGTITEAEMPTWQQDYARGLEMELYAEELSNAYAGSFFGDVVTDVLQRSDENDVLLLGIMFYDQTIHIHPGQEYVIPVDEPVLGVFVARDLACVKQRDPLPEGEFAPLDHVYESIQTTGMAQSSFLQDSSMSSAAPMRRMQGQVDPGTLWKSGVMEGQAAFARKLLVEAMVEADVIADLAQLDQHVEDLIIASTGEREKQLMAKSMTAQRVEPEGLNRYKIISENAKEPEGPTLSILQKGGHVLLVSAGGKVSDFVLPLRNPAAEMPAVVVLAENIPEDWYALVDLPESYLVRGSMRSRADLHRAGFTTARAIALQTVSSESTVDEPHLVDSEVLFTLKLIESQFPPDITPPFAVSELMMSSNQSFLESRDDAVVNVPYYLKKVYASGRVFTSKAITSLSVGSYYMPALNKLVKELVQSHVLVVSVPNGWERRPYRDLFTWLLWEKNLLAMGIYRKASARRGDAAYIFTSPPAGDVTLHASDKVFCLVPTRPKSAGEADYTKLGKRDPLEWFDRLVDYVNAQRDRELGEAFELYVNEEGTVAPKDFASVLRSQGLSPTDAEVNEMMEGAASKEGVSFDEFNQLAGDALEEGWDSPADIMKKSFQVIDSNGEGNLDATEMRLAFANIIGVHLEQSNCEELIAKYDTSGRGELNFEGWKAMVEPRMKKLAAGRT